MSIYVLFALSLVCLNPTHQTILNKRDIGNQTIPGPNSSLSCIINNVGQNLSGICQPISNCTANIGLLRAGVIPTLCPSHGRGVVCCPVEKRISTKKCEEFTSILTQPVKAKQALVYDGKTSDKDLDDKSIKCEAFLVSFITGGRKAREREYPYQVALGFGDKGNPDWRCGGTLIDDQYVLSAGHCVLTSYGPPKIILLGDRQLSNKRDSSRLLVNVSEIYLHPKYKPPLQYNDIAIIKLEMAINLSRSVLPACLPDPVDRLDRSIGVEATGWGQVGAMEGQSDTLQSVTLAKFDTNECSSFFAESPGNKQRLPNGILPSQFCAGDKEGFRDTCKGDSGGPLTVSKENNSCIHYIVGITSFGSNMCGYQQPGVYTNILSYLDWIENVVWLKSHSSGKSSLYTKIIPGNNGLVLLNPSVETTTAMNNVPISIKSSENPTTSVSTTTTAKMQEKQTTSTAVPTLPTSSATTTAHPTTTENLHNPLKGISTWPSLKWDGKSDITDAISEFLKKFSTG